jgi:hypothetical protein
MSKVFMRISFALGGAYFALGGILWPERHCCQGTEISAEKDTVKRAEKRDRIFDRFIKKEQKRGQTFQGLVFQKII